TRLCNAHTSGAEGCPPVVFLDGDDDVAWNDTAHYLNSAPHRRPSHVALQLGLGLLSLQRARPRSHHHPHPRVTGKVLEVFAARRDQGILSAREWTLRSTDRAPLCGSGPLASIN